MAIQMRRGSYSDFVPSRMLAGEFAVMTSDDPNTPDGKSAYVALSPNDVERILTETDLGDMTDAAERAKAAIAAIGDISELAVPLMTEDVRGGAKLGAGLAVVDDTLSLSGESYTSAEKTKLAGIEAGANAYTLPAASPSTLGGVKPDGTTITVEPDGTIHGASTYELPTMDANIKGGAKLGNGLRVDEDALSVGNLVHSGSGAEVVTDGCAIYSVDGEGWAEQDGTPTPENPQEIRVARGRNLFNPSNTSLISTGKYYSTEGILQSDSSWNVLHIPCKAGETYAVTWLKSDGTIALANISSIGANDISRGSDWIRTRSTESNVLTMTVDGYLAVPYKVGEEDSVQVELGTTPTPYVPYGHVGLEVTYDGTTTVTPIPLPSKGFAASLPDGTADALAIDSAGRWEWTGETDEVVLNGSTPSSSYTITTQNNDTRVSYSPYMGIGKTGVNIFMSDKFRSGAIDAIYFIWGSAVAPRMWLGLPLDISTTDDVMAWFAQNPVTVLFSLATPTIEHGYIDLPDLPSGATVSIPELREIGCSWFIAGVDELAKHAANWGKRAAYENEDIEDAIADLATRVTALES